MSDTSLTVTFVGAGLGSRGVHCPNVDRLPEVAMISVYEPDEERLDRVANPYEFSWVYPHHLEMVEKADPDGVYCVTNEQWSLGSVLDCLDDGKYVFIERELYT